MNADCGWPQWVFGMRSYAHVSKNQVALAAYERAPGACTWSIRGLTARLTTLKKTNAKPVRQVRPR